MTWNGRQLMRMVGNAGMYDYSFTYNDEGIRTSKNINGTVYNYTLEGSTILSQQWGNHLMVFLYDESGSPIGLQYRSTSYAEGVFDTYYYEKNVFGDIIGIYTEDGTYIGGYTYDAWGTIKTNEVTSATTLQRQIVRQYNPFRYRGYYYDTHSSLYYLQSRYYDPSTGRFINADGYINGNGDLIGYNMYAYCNNNPIMYTDFTGMFWKEIGDWFKKLGNAILNSIEVEIGTGYGIGGSKNVSVVEIEAEAYSDIYTLRLDDGELFMEDSGAVGISLKFLNTDKLALGVSGSFHHDYVDRYCSCNPEHNALTNPIVMATCENAEKTPIAISLPFVGKLTADNSGKDVVIGYSSSAHLGIGGHVSFGINISQIIREMRG